MKSFAALTAALLFAWPLAAAEKMSSLHDVTVKDIHGKDMALKSYSGKVLLVVNVASECGYTGQYAGLEALYRKHKDAGLVVLGVPCNQFGGQEPAGESAILQFCRSSYDVTFPLTAKVAVNGAKQSPLYAALTSQSSPFPGPVAWNFEKFLVGRDGKILKRFDSGTEPDSAELNGAVESALAAK
jgi:glutathione peroxidase